MLEFIDARPSDSSGEGDSPDPRQGPPGTPIAPPPLPPSLLACLLAWVNLAMLSTLLPVLHISNPDASSHEAILRLNSIWFLPFVKFVQDLSTLCTLYRHRIMFCVYRTAAATALKINWRPDNAPGIALPLKLEEVVLSKPVFSSSFSSLRFSFDISIDLKF